MTREEREGTVVHPEDVRLAAYVEGALSGERLAAVEAHLVECAECREAVTDVVLLLDEAPKRRRWWIGASAAAVTAAAALVLFVVAQPQGGPGTEADVAFRPGADADREGTATVEVVAPSALETAPVDSVKFIWRATASEALYRLTLTDSAGRVLWEETSRDTVLDLPTDMELSGEAEYLWYLDALLPDGEVATTGLRTLRVR